MWGERIVGVLAGVVLGLGIVAVFVFVFSEDTIDSASISQEGAAPPASRSKPTPKPHGRAPSRPGSAHAVVQVVGGAPPASGPAHLDAKQGDRVSFTIDSDSAVTLQLTGYGITREVEAGEPTPIRFKASRPGNFALINTGTHIAVAQLRVTPG